MSIFFNIVEQGLATKMVLEDREEVLIKLSLLLILF